MARSYSGSPYWDRYSGDSDHRKAGYTRVLAKPGLAEQASEFNEIQSIARDYIERLGSSIYKEGTIVSGCALHVDTAGKIVTIEAGRIFLEGLVRETNEVSMSITGSGVERIIVNLTTTLVTVSQDSSLRDPAQGAENYGLEGADREKQVVSFSVISGDGVGTGVEIYRLEDGVQPSVTTDVDMNTFVTTDVLAERTYDENGSYKVKGIMIRDMLEVVGDKVKAYITDGKAYIAGYSVSRETMSSVLLDQSTETRAVQSESHYYNSSYKKYELSNGPVAEVQNFTCLVSVIGERKSKGAKDGMDSLNHIPVDSITRVYETDSQGNITKTYSQGVDFKLYNDKVDWSLIGDNASEPSSGSTYYVDYVYNKSMVQGSDFNIENEADTAYIIFTDGGDKPDENSRMYVTYTYTLSRRDLIMMDALGAIHVIKGQPDKLKNLITPYNGSEAYLELGTVDVYPTDALTGEVISGIADVNNYNSVRFAQEDFYTMLQRIENLEDDIAILDMERDIEEGEDTASLNGYFTDSFKNINKSDLGYTAQIDGQDIAYTACVDYDNEELTTAADIQSADLEVNTSSSDDFAIYGTVVSAPYTPELVLRQSYVTGTMLVNPYASYGPLCQVVLNPAKDNWVDEKTIQVQNTINKATYSYSTKTYSHGYWSRNATRNLRNFLRTETKTTTTVEGTTTSKSTSSSVAKTLYEYMRIRDINVQGKAFIDGMTNIYCRFNGVPVSITATGSSVQGTTITVDGVSVKTINANENGSFTGKITVPSKVPCGTVNVTFTGKNSSGEEYSGTGVYSAVGTLLTTTITNQTVVTTHFNVLTEIDNLYSSDPLAQSFILDQVNDRVLIKLGLYFATKSSTRPAVLQIRDMVNGYPGERVFAEVALDPENVNIPSDPNVPVVTEVTLNQPVYCEAGKYYCFVVLSDSNAYSMYYAKMGQNILGTSEQLMINPYGVGVMFSSSNASTWTAHQDADLKFELYRSRYTGNGEIIFDEASIEQVTGIFLDAAYQDNNNVGLEWYYRYKTGTASTAYSDWLPVDTLTFRDLQAVTDKVALKAVIKTDFSTSPYIDVGRVSLRAFIDQKEATYISTHITEDDFDEPYQALKISYQSALPSGSSHDIYYMDTLDGNWIKLEADNNVTLETKRVDSEFTQYTWNVKKVNAMVTNPQSEGAKYFKLRIDLHTTVAYNRPRIRKLSAIFKYN